MGADVKKARKDALALISEKPGEVGFEEVYGVVERHYTNYRRHENKLQDIRELLDFLYWDGYIIPIGLTYALSPWAAQA